MEEYTGLRQYLRTYVVWLPWVLVLFVLIGSAITAVLLYRQKQVLLTQLDQLHANPVLQAQLSNQQLLDKVGQLMILPQGEQPTIATVNNLEALKDNRFFAQAKLGDKVFIYKEAQKAILYSMAMNKIIDVAPVNFADNQKSRSPVKNDPTQVLGVTIEDAK